MMVETPHDSFHQTATIDSSTCKDEGMDTVDEMMTSCHDGGGTERTSSTTTTHDGDDESVSVNSLSSQIHLNALDASHMNMFHNYDGNDITDKRIPVTSLNEIQYAHGGYAGAAPLLMDDKKWMMILEILMPDEHEILSSYAEQVAEKSDPLKIMKWAENNPGTFRDVKLIDLEFA